MLARGIPPDFRGGVYLFNSHTLSGQSRVYGVTQLCTDGVHCQESLGTGPVILKVVPVTGASFALAWSNWCAPLFSHTHYYWYEVGMLKVSEAVCMYVCIYVSIYLCMVNTLSKIWISRVALPILLVVS